MLSINMISTGQEVKGQGVGAAYDEIVRLLQTYAADELTLYFNSLKNCDINHVHTIHPFCYARMSMSLAPSCMHVHFLPETLEGSIHLPKIGKDAVNKYVISMYQSAQELIVVNPIFIDPLSEYGIDKEKINYIPNVVSSKSFFNFDVPDSDPMREAYNIKKSDFTVLGVGQVQTRKGVHDFVEIARSLPDVHFIWAGGFSFGAITDGYEDLTLLMENAPKNVDFVGIVDRDNINTLYNLCDVLLMTSYNELFPMAILEAVNAGIPILLRDLDLYKKIYFTDYLKASDNKEFIEQLTALKTSPSVKEHAIKCSNDIATFYSEASITKKWIDYYTGFNERWKGFKKSSPF